jgi:O-antigen/teichoic acid export membrane protein
VTDTRPLRAQVLRGGIGSFGIKSAYILIQFAVGVVLARFLGPESLGVYAFTIALVSVLVILAQCGFPSSLVRFVAIARSDATGNEIRRLIFAAGFIVSFLSLLLIAVSALLLSAAKDSLDREFRSALTIALFLVPLLALNATAAGAIRGLGHIIKAQAPDEIVKPMVFLGLLILLYWWGGMLTPQRALLFHVFAATGGLSLAIWLLVGLVPRPFAGRISEARISGNLQRSLPFLLLAGAQVINSQADILMLGVMIGREHVGQYRVALQVAEGLGVVLFSISVVIAPHIARLHALRDWQRLRPLLVYSHRAGTIIMLVFGVPVAIWSAQVIQLVFGSAYLPATNSLSILVLAKIAYATIGFAGLTISMFGRPGVATILTLATIAMNVSLNFALIPRFGIEGAAAATAASQFVVNLFAVAWLRREYALNVSALGRPR